MYGWRRLIAISLKAPTPPKTFSTPGYQVGVTLTQTQDLPAVPHSPTLPPARVPGCPPPSSPRLWLPTGLPQPLQGGQCGWQPPRRGLHHPVGHTGPGALLLLPEQQDLREHSECLPLPWLLWIQLSALPLLPSMVSADFCTAAILISTGAVLGRVNPIQMLLMALLEVPLFACNEYVLRSLLGVSDSGGSLTIHTFGAYFGLTVSRVLHRPHKDKRKEQQDVGHQPDLFAVVGTFCLWIFWPSFASATTTHDSAEPWAVLNLYFSMAASTLATFVLSPILYEEGTLQVAQLQDATLASAAVMGMAGEMLSTPFGALTAGFLASQLSLLGSRFLSPILRSRLKTEDTCGVHNVHGLPGILGTFLGTLLAALATADVYGDRLQLVFPLVAEGSRTNAEQAHWQLCGLLVTLLLAASGGGLTGILLRTKVLRSPPEGNELESKVLREMDEDGCDRGASSEERGNVA
ncbi:ammonium transporter Rh type B-like isoform X1 [Lagopus leucura]|uniref:ammonium transporter Rh type B-like isoform X1 n=1 Tax=Lagopus leucura TaxID=30410 RepID=UPI001C6774EE|nr:ammonium transporter Rh type B-like isoform X1 [Lagopus leucura]